MFIGILIITALLAFLAFAGISAAMGLRRYAARTDRATQGDAWSFDKLPPTSVVIPCKGDDGTLLENLETLVKQEHPWIEYILVTATAEDPAVAAFNELKRHCPESRIKTVVAGIRSTCSQQNGNQIAGVNAMDASSRVIVVMDSDGQADRRFVAKLVAPLKDVKLGATSGYRWYDPRWESLPDMLRTVWNAGGFAFLVNPQTCFVWGGAMAFRRETYESAGIEQVWANALSDDMTLSRRLKERGLELRFVPDCIVVSKERDTLVSAVRWTNRQTLVTRFYNRPFWVMASVFHVLGNALGWAMLALGVLAPWLGFAPNVGYAALLGGVIWVGHLWLYGMLMVGPLEALLRPRGIVLGSRRWTLVAVAPLASLLQGINSINSFFTRDIRWAGVTYHIINHEKMHVV